MFKTKKCINTIFTNRGLNSFKNILQITSITNTNTNHEFKLSYLMNNKFTTTFNFSKLNSNNISYSLIHSDVLSKNEGENAINKESLNIKKTTKKEKVVKEKDTKVKSEKEKEIEIENKINKNKNIKEKNENKEGEKSAKKKITKKIEEENEPCNII
jgi:hypothetical protein